MGQLPINTAGSAFYFVWGRGLWKGGGGGYVKRHIQGRWKRSLWKLCALQRLIQPHKRRLSPWFHCAQNIRSCNNHEARTAAPPLCHNVSSRQWNTFPLQHVSGKSPFCLRNASKKQVSSLTFLIQLHAFAVYDQQQRGPNMFAETGAHTLCIKMWAAQSLAERRVLRNRSFCLVRRSCPIVRNKSCKSVEKWNPSFFTFF